MEGLGFNFGDTTNAPGDNGDGNQTPSRGSQRSGQAVASPSSSGSNKRLRLGTTNHPPTSGSRLLHPMRSSPGANLFANHPATSSSTPHKLGFPLSVQQATNVVCGANLDPDLSDKALRFASKGLGEQLLQLYILGESNTKHTKQAQRLVNDVWEIPQECRINIRKEAKRMVRNPCISGFVNEAEALTNKIFDRQWGVSKDAGKIPARRALVKKEASVNISRVKADLKKVIWDAKTNTVNQGKLEDFATNLFRAKVLTEDHVQRAAMMRALTAGMNEKSRAPKEFWISMTRGIQKYVALDDTARQTIMDECLRNKRQQYTENQDVTTGDSDDDEGTSRNISPGNEGSKSGFEGIEGE
ncbi:uncharacterized protein EV422DRAFT_502696 [Fimicolochytrium jonesii]|uniref:uncharacterized protein n=1 Tax=Fimicolochytrium jonesii TaxID=1396493 RepID=UPI0022FDF4CE|nr:uncharacterized protein EV422DRAFT_502696 [Fimicolochytrium jonesii]KAI8826979.1 hypothetical protein EV422DRAFT_502696 [Fimicolochytrium jonesii]